MSNDIVIKLGLDGAQVFGAAIDAINAKINTLGGGAGAAGEATNRGFTKAAQGVRSISQQLDLAKNSLLAYISAGSLRDANSWVTRQASDLRELQDRIKSATQSAGEASSVINSVFAQSNRWGSAVSETATAFARLNPAMRAMGLGSTDTLKMLDGLSASLRLSGATTAETTAVLLQFSQAMGSGRVGGDEFRSMMENALPLMSAVAGQLGVSTGELRNMAEQGKLTSSVFANALLPAIDGLTKRAEQIGPTIGQAMQQLKNNALKDFGREFKEFGESSARGIAFLSENTLEFAAAAHAATDAIGELIKVTAAAVGGAGLGALVGTLSKMGGGLSAVAGGVTTIEGAIGTLALTLGAFKAKILSMGAGAVGGLIGIALFGLYEAGQWVGELEQVREALGRVLEPVFRAMEFATTDNARRKSEMSLQDAKARLAELQALKASGVSAQAQPTEVLGMTSTKLVPIDELIAQAKASEEKLQAAYTSMYEAPAKAAVKATVTNRASAAGEYATLTKDLQFREKIVADYADRLLKLQTSYADKYRETVGDAAKAQLQKTHLQNLDAMLRDRKSALEGAGDAKEAKEAARIRLDAIIAGYEQEQSAVVMYEKQAQDTLKSFRETGLISEETYLERKRDLALQANAESVALVQKELDATRVSSGLDQKEKLTALAKYNAELKKLAIERGGIWAKFSSESAQSVFKAQEDVRAGLEKEIESLSKSNKALELHNQEIGLTTEQLNALVLARQDAAISALQAKVDTDRAAESQGVYNDTLQEEYDRLAQLKRQRELTSDGQTRQKAADSAKETFAEWKRGWEETDRLGRDVFTSWVDGGTSAAKKIGDTLKKALLSAIYEATIKPLVFQIYSAFSGGDGSAAGMAKQFGGSGSGILNAVGSGKSFFDAVTGSIEATFSAAFSKFASSSVGQSLGLWAKGNNASAAGLSQTGQLVQTAGAYTLGAMGGHYIGGAISNGYSVNGGSGNTAVNAGTIIGLVLGGPIGGAIGGAIGGLINRAFGTKLADQGLQGSFGGASGFTGENYQFYKGGWFRSDSTKTSALDPALVTAIGQAFNQQRGTVGLLGSQIGLDSSGLASYSSSIKFSTSGLTSDQIKKKLDEELTRITEEMATQVLSGWKGVIADLQKTGETASQTLQRLASSLTVANGVFDTLGQKVLSASVENADAMSKLLDLFGGTDAFTQTTSDYFDKYYTQAQKTAKTTEQVSAAFKALGLEMPKLDNDARIAFRALVEKQDLTTESGRATYAALLKLSGAFASITPSADEAAAAVAATAAAAEEAAKALAKTNAGWQDKLDLLTGKSTDRSIALRDATDETTRALMRQVYAQEDLNAAAQKFASSIDSLGSSGFDLENQILTLQGKDAEAKARIRKADLERLTGGITDKEQIDRITAAYDYNESLKEQIKVIQQTTEARNAADSAAQAAASSAAQAAEQLRQAWQSVTDSIFTEVKRIRDLMGGSGAQSFAASQANFAIATAQARAGDQNAAKLLPGLSQAMLALAEANATSLAQLRTIQGQTAATLEAIGRQYGSQYSLTLPTLDTGTNFVPQDMIALIHKGEAVVPAAYNPASGGAGAGNGEVVAELRALRAEVENLKSLQADNNSNVKTTADTLVRVTRGGQNMVTKDYAVA